MPWKQIKNGGKYWVPREKSPAEIIYQQEQRRLHAEQVFQQERERHSPTNAVSPPQETLPQRKPKEYADLLRCLLEHLRDNGEPMRFVECLGSPANMMKLLHEHDFVSADEVASKGRQRTLANHMKKYDGARGAIVIDSQDGYRVDVGELEDMAAGNGITCARNKGEKPHDHTGKFNQQRKA